MLTYERLGRTAGFRTGLCHLMAVMLLWGAAARAQTPPAAPTPPASPGPAAEYDITIKHTPEPLVAQALGQLSVVITPHAPWLLKTTTPFTLALQGPESVTFKQAKFGARDFVDAKMPAKTLATAFTPKEAGEQHINVDLMFFLCSDTVCQRHKETRDYVLPVAPPAAPAPPPPAP